MSFEPLYKLFSSRQSRVINKQTATHISSYISQELTNNPKDYSSNIQHAFRIIIRAIIDCEDEEALMIMCDRLTSMLVTSVKHDDDNNSLMREYLMIQKLLAVIFQHLSDNFLTEVDVFFDNCSFELPFQNILTLYPTKLSIPISDKVKFLKLFAASCHIAVTLYLNCHLSDLSPMISLFSAALDTFAVKMWHHVAARYLAIIRITIQQLSKLLSASKYFIASMLSKLIENMQMETDQLQEVYEQQQSPESFLPSFRKLDEYLKILSILLHYRDETVFSSIRLFYEKTLTNFIRTSANVYRSALQSAPSSVDRIAIIHAIESIMKRLIYICNAICHRPSLLSIKSLSSLIIDRATFLKTIDLSSRATALSADSALKFFQSWVFMPHTAANERSHPPSKRMKADDSATTSHHQSADLTAIYTVDMDSLLHEIILAAQRVNIQASAFALQEQFDVIAMAAFFATSLMKIISQATVISSNSKSNPKDLGKREREHDAGLTKLDLLLQAYAALFKQIILSIKTSLNRQSPTNLQCLSILMVSLQELIRASQKILDRIGVDVLDKLIAFVIDENILSWFPDHHSHPISSSGNAEDNSPSIAFFSDIFREEGTVQTGNLILVELFDDLLHAISYPRYSAEGDGGVFYLKSSLALLKWNIQSHPAILLNLCVNVHEQVIYLQNSSSTTEAEINMLVDYILSGINTVKAKAAEKLEFSVACYESLLKSFTLLMGIPEYKITSSSTDFLRLSPSTSKLSAMVYQRNFQVMAEMSSSGIVTRLFFEMMMSKWSNLLIISNLPRRRSHLTPPILMSQGIRDIFSLAVYYLLPKISSAERQVEGDVDLESIKLIIALREVLIVFHSYDFSPAIDYKQLDKISNDLDAFIVTLIKNKQYAPTTAPAVETLIVISLLQVAYRSSTILSNLTSFGKLEELLTSPVFVQASYDHQLTMRVFSKVASICAVFHPRLSMRVIFLYLSIWSRNMLLASDPLIVQKTAFICNEFRVFIETGLLRYLLVQYPELFSEHVIMPMLLSDRASVGGRVMDVIPDLLRELCNFINTMPAALIDEKTQEDINIRGIIENIVILKIIFLPKNDASSIALERLQAAFPHIFDTSNISSNIPISERPALLYKLLIADELQQYEVKELVHGHFLRILNHCAKQLRCPLFAENDSTLQPYTITRTLLPLLWDLASKHSKHDLAVKALQIFCTLSRAKLWSIPTTITTTTSASRANMVEEDSANSMSDSLFEESESRAIELNEDKNVAYILSEYFLYIISKSIQNQWTSKTLLEQAHCMRMLQRIIGFFTETDIVKYLPKITILLNLALSSTSPYVQDPGIDLLSLLLRRLPVDLLQQQLPSYTVSLFDMMDRLEKVKHVSIKQGSDDNHGSLKWQSDRNQIPFHPIRNELLDAYFPVASLNLFEYLHSESLIQDAQDRLFTKALSLIRKIFVDDRIIEISSIAYLPNIRALESLVDHHRKAMAQLSLKDSILMHMDLLKHESSSVREKTLILLADIIHRNLEKLHGIDAAMLVEKDTTPTGFVSELMQSLLALSAKESEAAVVIALASCLGNLGAVDPSRIVVSSLSSSSLSTGIKAGSATAGTPWELSFEATAFFLLESYLIPILTSDPLTQDRTGFAIQAILKGLADHYTVRSKTSGKDSLPASAATTIIMPAEMKQTLRTSQIYEVVEPFWHTKYQYNAQSNGRPPFYKPGMRYHKWLAEWIPWLIASSRGPLNVLYSACRGTILKRPEIGLYMLPRLILDVIITHYDHKGTKDAPVDRKIFESIILEIIAVLTGEAESSRSVNAGATNSQENHMCIQAIFNILDCFSIWTSKVSAATPNRRSSSSSTSATGAMNAVKAALRVSPIDPSTAVSPSVMLFATAKQIVDVNHGFYTNAMAAVQAIFAAIPVSALVDASIRIKAYARALRYLEVNSRLQHIAKERQSSTTASAVATVEPATAVIAIRIHEERNDGSNHALPILSYPELNSLLKISSNLEDRDAVHGTLILKHLSGYGNTASDLVLEYEQEDDWQAALNEYGQMQLTCNEAESHIELERGRLRCLIEIGQLNAVIDQMIGIRDRDLPGSEAILPLGVEAAWKLGQWSRLEDFLQESTSSSPAHYSMEDSFMMSIGEGLVHMVHGDIALLSRVVTDSRKKIMSALAAASMESYNRCYPQLERLQVLVDLEKAAHLSIDLRARQRSSAAPSQIALVEDHFRELKWKQRINILSSSPKQRSTSLSLHRILLSHFQLNSQLTEHFYQTSEYYKSIRHFDESLAAIRQAKAYGLDADTVMLQECKLLKETAQPGRALMLIEPIEVNVTAIRSCLAQYSKSKDPTVLPDFLRHATARSQLAEKILLATQIVTESKQKHGKSVVNRYKCAIDLKDGSWDQAHYAFARYHDDSYTSMASMIVESNHRPSSAGSNGSQSSSRDHHYSNELAKAKSLLYACEQYLKCVAASSTYILQALPRLLTLWLSFTSNLDAMMTAQATANPITNRPTVKTSSAGSSTSSSSKLTEQLKSYQTKLNHMVDSFSRTINALTWYSCLPQLISRTGHPNPETLRIIESIITMVLIAYPQQGIWHLAGLAQSINAERKAIANNILKSVMEGLARDPSRSSMRHMLRDATVLCKSLVDLAAYQTSERKIKYSLPSGIHDLLQILVPTQAVLQSSSSTAYIYIQSIEEYIDVANSKARPKTMAIRTTDGQRIKFLVKQEKAGDLRKDARIMEFNSIINRLLASSHEGRSRKLRLRTYGVTCLTEESGILEWVNDTTCIRHIISEAYSYWPSEGNVMPMLDFKLIHQSYQDFQRQYETDLKQLTTRYRQEISAKTKPCLSRWFLETYRDAMRWYDSRVTFSRSVAVWSSVGYVVGLGDRHSENILIDINNGECVHVDFDCLFDKGLTLPRPELVPFRLTPNMVEAMGLTGVEGHCRCAMEVVLTTLRENKEILMSVLEPFLRDPTVAWTRSGRAAQQRSSAAESASEMMTRATNFQDHENAEAKETLRKISARLSGVYNIVHPYADRIIEAYHRRNETLPEYGLGAAKEDGLPLSVSGQVQRLIAEATCEENLAQMYVGWQPWL
jgi:hypothetical protein